MVYRILLIKDRRPGHFRKSEGIAKALGRHLPVSVEEIAVAAPRGIPGSLLRRLVVLSPAASLLLALWGIRPEQLARPDLIVSAGAETLVPNVLLARHFRCRNVFSGSIRRIPPERFSLILHTHPRARAWPRHLVVLLPSVIDPDVLRAPRPFAGLDGRTVALLIGGPSDRAGFVPEDWQALHRLVRETAVAGLSWRITSSRRTPDAVADQFAALAAAMPGSVDFIDYREGKSGSIDPLFNADAMLVTEDSNTMIAEAVAARRPVIVLRAARTGQIEPLMLPLIEARRIAALPMRDATPERLVEAIRSTRPLEQNPLDILYDGLASAGIGTPDGTIRPQSAAHS